MSVKKTITDRLRSTCPPRAYDLLCRCSQCDNWHNRRCEDEHMVGRSGEGIACGTLTFVLPFYAENNNALSGEKSWALFSTVHLESTISIAVLPPNHCPRHVRRFPRSLPQATTEQRYALEDCGKSFIHGKNNVANNRSLYYSIALEQSPTDVWRHCYNTAARSSAWRWAGLRRCGGAFLGK